MSYDWSDSFILQVAELDTQSSERTYISKTSDGTLFRDDYPGDGIDVAFIYSAGDYIPDYYEHTC